MKTFFFASVAALAMATSSAQAADMPVKAPPVVVATSYNWSGFYIGALGTHGWADAQHCSVIVPCEPTFPQTDMRGWLGGVTVGGNYQLNNIVFGVEGDWSGGKLKGSSPSTPTYGCAGTCDNSISSVATFRGRVGLAHNQFLGYVTAGVAWERLQASLGAPVLVSTSTTKSNFVFGGGVEFAFSNNVSAKIEYLRTSKLGTFVYDNNGTCGAAICTVEVKSLDLLRFGLNYRFGGGGHAWR